MEPIFEISLSWRDTKTVPRYVDQDNNCIKTIGGDFDTRISSVTDYVGDNSTDFDSYLDYIRAATSAWSLEERKCMVTRAVSQFNENYTGSDTMRNWDSKDIYENYQ